MMVSIGIKSMPPFSVVLDIGQICSTSTVWKETLEGANFGEMAKKTSLAELILVD